ncbi:PGPGW domain-containing protein [Ornithinimicrobium sufpigmenti]|uniref:PGPGW domain-containing protein n=1 Tax=Ornithinimicrobium sufpigmenti TaxID=2508882 RepID=UPI0010357BE6|nr:MULTISPECIES: PGPGW domain-containing protein [unclassified Ornithinimicrobium]
MSATAKRLGLETLGWVVLVAGLLALVLPGPGLLLTFAGLAILSTQYRWARRMMHPVRVKAWRGAAEGAQTIPRILLSGLAALVLLAVGVLWIVQPPAPGWWSLPQAWWLFGGVSVGVTFAVSAVIALGLLVFAVHRFYRKPDALEAVERLEEAHRARRAATRTARNRLRRMRERGTPWRRSA